VSDFASRQAEELKRRQAEEAAAAAKLEAQSHRQFQSLTPNDPNSILPQPNPQQRPLEPLNIPISPEATGVYDEISRKLGLPTSYWYQRQHGFDTTPPSNSYQQLMQALAATDRPMEEINKIKISQFLGERLNMPAGAAYANMDQLSEMFMGEVLPPARFLEGLRKHWVNGVTTHEINEVFNVMSQTADPARREQLLKQVQEMRTRLIPIKEPPKFFALKWLDTVVDSAPQMLQSFLVGGVTQMVTAGTAGAMLGSLPPLSLPTGGLSAAAMAAAVGTVGLVVGTTQAMAQNMRGAEYGRMIEAGVPHNVASEVSLISGYVQGALESAGELLVGLPFIPFASIGERIAGKILLTGFGVKIATDMAVKLLAAGAGEGIENSLQYLTQAAADQFAIELSKDPTVKLDTPSMEALVKEFGNQFYQGFGAGIIFGIAGMPKGVRADVKQMNSIKRLAMLMPDRESFIKAVVEEKIGEGAVDSDSWKNYLGKVYDRQQQIINAELAKRNAAEAEGAAPGAAPAAAPVVPKTVETRVESEGTGPAGERSILIAGKAETKERFAFLRYSTIGNTINVTEVVNEPGYSLDRELMVDLIQQNPGKVIEWQPQTETQAIIKEDLIANNPNGPQAGLTYILQANAATEAEHAAQQQQAGMAQQAVTIERFKQAFQKSYGLTEEQAEYFGVLAERRARKRRIDVNQWLGRIVKPGVINESPEMIAAMTNRVNRAGEPEPAIAATTFSTKEGGIVEPLSLNAKGVQREVQASFSALRGADFHHAVHEFFHMIERLDLEPEEIRMFELAVGVPRAKWTTAIIEDLAQKFEDYLATGKAPTPELQSIFQRIAEIFNHLVSYMRGKDLLHPDFVRAYDAIFAVPEGGLRQAGEAEITAPRFERIPSDVLIEENGYVRTPENAEEYDQALQYAEIEEDNGPEIGDPVDLPPALWHIRDIEGWENQVTAYMRENGFTTEEIKTRLAAMQGQMKLFNALGPHEIEFFPVGAHEITHKFPRLGTRKSTGVSEFAGFGPIRGNADPIYRVTFDASAMCPKRLAAAATQLWLQGKLDRALSGSERLALVSLFKMNGKTAPCIYCYVESPRGKAGEFVSRAQAIIRGEEKIPARWSAEQKGRAKKAQAEYKKNQVEVDPNIWVDPAYTATDSSQEKIKESPAIYQFIHDQYLAAKSNIPKLYEAYDAHILHVPDTLIKELNNYAGFRFFSSSYFQLEHLVDIMQAFNDLEVKRAKSHSYSKVVDFVELVGNTRQKVNTSVFAREENGQIVEDAWQGMGWADAQRLREKYPDVGTILVATSDAIVEWGLNQPWVDYIIPFHYSGLEKRFYETLDWADFTSSQKEKWAVDPKTGKRPKKGHVPQIRMYEMNIAEGITNQELGRRYLELCRERGLEPVFAKWQNHPEFGKLKKDFARTDTPFVETVANFDMAKVEAIMQKVIAGEAPRAEPDLIVGKQLLQKIKEFKFRPDEDIGVAALRAVQNGVEISQPVREGARRPSEIKALFHLEVDADTMSEHDRAIAKIEAMKPRVPHWQLPLVPGAHEEVAARLLQVLKDPRAKKKAFLFERKGGGLFALVTPSARSGAKWQVTYWDKRGPSGHDLYNSHVNALLDSIRADMVVSPTQQLPAEALEIPPKMDMEYEWDQKATDRALFHPAGVEARDAARIKLFDETIAQVQRGKAEEAMKRAQIAIGGGVYGFAIEHTGDLEQRMTKELEQQWGDNGYGMVADKVDKVLSTLEHRYGFMKEHQENLEGNAKYNEIPLEQYKAKVDSTLKRYAEEHRKLPAYNQVQQLARASAIALGEQRVSDAIGYLHQLKEIVDKGPDNWRIESSKYEPGNYVTPTGEVIALFHADPKEIAKFNKLAKKTYGTTDDPSYGAWILTDGEMLDFKTKEPGYDGMISDVRLTHSDIRRLFTGTSAENMNAYDGGFHMSAVRNDFYVNSAAIQSTAVPNAAQMAQIGKWISTCKRVFVEVMPTKMGERPHVGEIKNPTIQKLQDFYNIYDEYDETGDIHMLAHPADVSPLVEAIIAAAARYETPEAFQADMEASFGMTSPEAARSYQRIWDAAHPPAADVAPETIVVKGTAGIPAPEKRAEEQYDYEEKEDIAQGIKDPELAKKVETGDFTDTDVDDEVARSFGLEQEAKEALAAEETKEIELTPDEQAFLRDAEQLQAIPEKPKSVSANAMAKRLIARLTTALKKNAALITLVQDLEETAREDKVWQKAISDAQLELKNLQMAEQRATFGAATRMIKENAAEERARLKSQMAAQRREAAAKKRAAMKDFRAQVAAAWKKRVDLLKLKEARRKLINAIMAPVSIAIEYKDYADRILFIQRQIDPRSHRVATLEERQASQAFFNQNQDAAALVPKKTLELIYSVPVQTLTLAQLEELHTLVEGLKKLGRLKRGLKLTQHQRQRASLQNRMVNAILRGESLDKVVGAPKGTPARLRAWMLGLKPGRIAQLLDGIFAGITEKGPFWYVLQEMPNKAWDAMTRVADKRRDKVMSQLDRLHITLDATALKRLKGYTYVGEKVDIEGFKFTDERQPTWDDVMYWYLGIQNEKTKAALMYGNNIPEEVMLKGIAMLPPNLKKLADLISSDFDENFERYRDAFIENFNEDLPKEHHYVTMNRREISYKVREEKVMAELTGRSGLTRHYVDRGSTNQRLVISDEHQTPIATNLMGVWMDAVRDQEGFIHQDMMIRDMHSMLGNDQVRHAIQQRYGPAMNEWLRHYTNDLAQDESYQGQLAVEKWSRIARSKAAIAWLSFNLLSASKQFIGWINALADAGPLYLASAAMQFAAGQGKSIVQGKFFNNTLVDFVQENSLLIKHRRLSQEFEDLRRLNNTTYQQLVKKVGTLGMKGLELMDLMSVTIDWKAVYDKTMSKTNDKALAIKTADEAIIRTQPSMRVQDMAEMYRAGEAMKWFTMFTSDLNATYNRMAFDVPAALRNGQVLHAFGDMLSFALAGVWITVASGALSGSDDEKKKKKIILGAFSQYFEALPFVGNDVFAVIQKAAKTGYYFQSGGVKIFPAIEYFQTIPSEIAEKEWAKAITSLAEATGFTVGLPVSGTRRAVKVMTTGDWEALLGWPTKKKE
jgi:hypothetical protein